MALQPSLTLSHRSADQSHCPLRTESRPGTVNSLDGCVLSAGCFSVLLWLWPTAHTMIVVVVFQFDGNYLYSFNYCSTTLCRVIDGQIERQIACFKVLFFFKLLRVRWLTHNINTQVVFRRLGLMMVVGRGWLTSSISGYSWGPLCGGASTVPLKCSLAAD